MGVLRCHTALLGAPAPVMQDMLRHAQQLCSIIQRTCVLLPVLRCHLLYLPAQALNMPGSYYQYQYQYCRD